ncbi:MAG: methionyl-tRNA formyltransferase [Planctomycetes bacterium]|nr:methionyl-tRNA formyltransferase [Planctomycetota bacterium]
MASGDFAVPTLRALVDRGHDLPLVITQPDKGSGRGRRAQCTPVKKSATDLGLNVLATPSINDEAIVEQLRALKPELGLAIAFGQKIGPEVRSVFSRDCINLHASLLPKYRGAAPFQWSVINGEQTSGVTTFRLVDRMDAGPIYLQRSTALNPQERACELHDRLAGVGVDAVNATIELLEADPCVEPTPQDDAGATRAPKLSKSDGFLSFDQPVAVLANRINGLWDWPGARCVFKSAATGKTEEVILALARVGSEEKPTIERPTIEPGTLDFRCQVAASDGLLEVLEVKPAGGRLMPFEAYVNGRHIQSGDRFETFTG